MMRKLLILLIIALFASGCSLIKTAQAPVERAGMAVNTLEQAKDVVGEVNKQRVVTLELTFNADDTRSFQIPYEEGSNALNILERAGLNFEVKEYSFGTLVDSIEGVKGGQEGKYWIYYLNGVQGQTAAAAAVLSAGDTLEWRFQKEDGTYE